MNFNWKKPFAFVGLLSLALLATSPADARERRAAGDAGVVQAFENGSSYQLCFVPDGASCVATLVSAIDAEQSMLLIQAYEFTERRVAEAVVRAKQRGVDVRVIVDKEELPEDVRTRLSGRREKSKGLFSFGSENLNKRSRSSFDVAKYFVENSIPLVVDLDPAIAHNKIMIFGANLKDPAKQGVFTGSFNFTVSAQERNAENGLIIRGDSRLVQAYTDNWSARWRASTPYKNLVGG